MGNSASVATARDQQRTVIVLGMHRSGTSALTGSLEAGGIHLGDTKKTSFDNIKGNRESQRIMVMHNDILARNGGSWMKPVLSPKWHAIHITARELIVDTFAQHDVWGFKDPRTLFVLDEWLNYIPNAELVGIFRHPYFVAESLHRRNELPYEKGLELWVAYNTVLFEQLDHRGGFPLVEFTASNTEFKQQLQMLSAALKLNAGYDSFFDPDLKQSSLPELPETALTKSALDLYKALQQARLDSPRVDLAI